VPGEHRRANEKPRFPERIGQAAQLVWPTAQAVQEQTSDGLACWDALRFIEIWGVL
jgi:hypothetical protein